MSRCIGCRGNCATKAVLPQSLRQPLLKGVSVIYGLPLALLLVAIWLADVLALRLEATLLLVMLSQTLCFLAMRGLRTNLERGLVPLHLETTNSQLHQ